MKRVGPTFAIPNEHEGDLGHGVLYRLPRQAGVSREEWLGK